MRRLGPGYRNSHKPRLAKDDFIVTAWAESASGPGWSNTPLWILIRSGSGELRIECLQPDRHTSEIYVLYGASMHLHLSMRREVERVLTRRAKVLR